MGCRAPASAMRRSWCARTRPIRRRSRLPGAHVRYPAQGANPTNVELRQDYFDSLHYCSAVVGVNTSAFLEAAILGRPVLTCTSERYAETQAGMLHFNHLLTAGGGLLHVSQSYDEHAAQLRDALAAPHPEGATSERSRRFTEEFIRPFGPDEPATPRMLDAIEAIARAREALRKGREASVTGRVLARLAHAAVKRELRRRPPKPVKAPKAAKPPKAPKAPKTPKPSR